MTRIRHTLAWALLLLFAMAPLAQAQQHEHNDRDIDSQAVGSNLPPKLRGLLIQEMMSLLDASKNILDALMRGEDALVAHNAQGIHDSFILAQEMTDADRQALHDSVPHAFLERDQALHSLAADLAEAARAGDQVRQRSLFTEMVNACVECHAVHALDRFPALGRGAR